MGLSFRLEIEHLPVAETRSLIVALSTTDRGPDELSTTFADNVGPDNTIVFDGTVNFESSGSMGLDLGVFDITINFTTPFVYDPSAGDLLLDITNTSDFSLLTALITLDGQRELGDSVSRVFSLETMPEAITGDADTTGLITQFTTSPLNPEVPEPPAFILWLVVALTIKGGCRRRSAHN